MKLFVIGATGRTGQEIVQQALARGHQVTAFVRSPENITTKSERLTVLKGNVLDENQLFNAMRNHDAVVSTLGPAPSFQTELDASRQRACHYSGNGSRRSETACRSLGGGALPWNSQSDRQFHHAKSHARFAGHGRNRAIQRLGVDHRPASSSHAG